MTLLALKNSQGKVLCSLPFLDKSAGVTLEQCLSALEKFKSPDSYSTTKANEGRRIEAVEGGWLILNHLKYLEGLGLENRRAYWAQKKREARARRMVAGKSSFGKGEAPTRQIQP